MGRSHRSRFVWHQSTTGAGFSVTARDILAKFGEVAITILWVFSNCSVEPSPWIETV